MLEQNDITPELIMAQGLTLEEYDNIIRLLGRPPNIVELGIFGVMWSEHCSYKSSKIYLKKLPTSGECVIQGPGENAGIVDIGDGWCVAFKIESHNHPSFIEPYQGAATGVGGILRDIFTMGARPVAAMNSLRFGPLDDPSNRTIMAGVVKGIGDYGNCFGVPTVGGEVAFSACYSKNPLVNAFALGLVRKDQIFYGQAGGVGNSVLYVGSKTGRDGIHGATMASAEFDEASFEKRPNVQVGDPFLEKLLLEACLEALRTGAVVGMQDMGAAGLTCSSCEMGSRVGTGIDIDLDLVPQRETAMSPYEMMLSESQERMLLVVTRGHEREVMDIFKKWDLDAVVIGIVTDSGKLVVQHEGRVVVDIPNVLLTDNAPVYERTLEIRSESDNNSNNTTENYLWTNEYQFNKTYRELLIQVLTSPNISSRNWIYQQYDHMVRTNSMTLPGGNAAVIRVKETRRSIAMTLDGNNRYCRLDPRAGVRLIIAEAARNLVCVGARPLALTNCLNFASPERPHVMWSFSEVINGMAEACQALGTPVTGGNVSFYNETDGHGIDPTPVIGMIGVIEDPAHLVNHLFKTEGDVVMQLGETLNDMGGSEFLSHVYGLEAGPIPELNLEHEIAVQSACLEAIRLGLLKSVHDCSDGGLAVALAECCFAGNTREPLGVHIDTTLTVANTPPSLVPYVFLFSESPSRIIVSIDEDNMGALVALLQSYGVPHSRLGQVCLDDFFIRLNDDLLLCEPIQQLEEFWMNRLSLVLG